MLLMCGWGLFELLSCVPPILSAAAFASQAGPSRRLEDLANPTREEEAAFRVEDSQLLATPGVLPPQVFHPLLAGWEK